jgi:hypothetical protein
MKKQAVDGLLCVFSLAYHRKQITSILTHIKLDHHLLNNKLNSLVSILLDRFAPELCSDLVFL